jgi:hypothetical protein
MTTRRIGTRLIGWSERLLTPDFVDNLVLPVIADMQFEQEAAAQCPVTVRHWTRLKAYLVFAKALGLGILVKQGRTFMSSNRSTWVRLGLAVPAALGAALAVQYLVGFVFRIGLQSVLAAPAGLTPNPSLPVAIGLSRTMTSPLIAASFVGIMWLVAPPAFRRITAVVAQVAVIVWCLYVASVAMQPFFVESSRAWLLASMVTGFLGAVFTFVMLWRTSDAPRTA